MQLRNVDLRSVGPSVQKLWPTTFLQGKCLVFYIVTLNKLGVFGTFLRPAKLAMVALPPGPQDSLTQEKRLVLY